MHSPYDTVHMEWWWNGWSIWYSPYRMVVECLVHMAQSTWNGSEMDGPYGTVYIAQSIWNGGGMPCSYGTVYMEWWWNAWSIWHSVMITLSCPFWKFIFPYH